MFDRLPYTNQSGGCAIARGRIGPAGRQRTAWLRHALLALVALVALGARPAPAAEIWFGGVDPFVRQVMQPGAPSDYTALFQADAPWSKAAAQVQVFETSTQFVNRGSDEQLRQMFESLRQRHMKLALGALMQTQPPNCGQNVEGYAAAGAMAAIAGKITRLGGSLDYVAMDEPLWFGHRYDGPQACHASIADIARNVAANVAAIRRVFPDVRIGDGEPFPVDTSSPAWLDEIAQWIAAYRAATGENLAFLQTDMNWHAPWRRPLGALAAMLTAAGIKYGMIYDGDPDAQTGVAWTEQAERHFVEVESDPATTPEQAVLYSWMQHPLHFLPESQRGTMTWLVNRYAAAETRIVLQRTGLGLTGRLATADGRPAAGQAVQIFAVDAANAGPLADVTQSGIVPREARAALFALRANTECNCSGPVDVTVGTLRFRDDRTGQEVARRLMVRGSVPAAGGIRITGPAGQAIAPNTPSWPVTPGDAWTINVAMGASTESIHSGYVALIFSSGQRVFMPFAPATRTIGTATTDPAGQFTFVADAARLPPNPGFLVKFPGSELYRMSEATLP